MSFKQADLVRIEALMKKWRQEDPTGFEEAVKRVESTPTSSTGSENVSNNGVISPVSANASMGGVHLAKEDSVGYGKSKSDLLKIKEGDDEQTKMLKDIISRHFDEYDDVFKALA
ncbi:MAG: hypothetical protein AAF741_07385 [Bacteroidota bacterium]